jgi:hypothetical protein
MKKVNPYNFSLVGLPGPCGILCKHYISSFEDMKEPCQHITSLERWVEVNTNYSPY